MQRKHPTRKLLPAIAIIGDGESEYFYFQQLKEIERILNFSIKPELPNRSGKGGGFEKVFGKVRNLLDDGFDHVFCLIDMDVVVKDQKLAEYAVQKLKMEKAGCIVLECNPCFEIWFLLHFQKMARLFNNCGEVESLLKKEAEFNGYDKSLHFFRQKNVYQLLKKRLHDSAIPNSKWLENQQATEKSPNFPRCEVFKFIEKCLPQA